MNNENVPTAIIIAGKAKSQTEIICYIFVCELNDTRVTDDKVRKGQNKPTLLYLK